MRKLLLFLVVVFATLISFSQTNILNNNFEGVGDDGWTMANSATNIWKVGTVGSPSGGTKHAFISNDGGVTNTYTITSATASHLYRSVTFPAGEGAILLSFDVRGTGEPGITTTSYDYIRVSLTTAAPAAGTVPAVTDQLPAYFSGYTTHKKVWVAIPASYAGLTRNLVFTFRCETLGGDVSAGFAVDNITLTSNTVTALTGTKTLQSGGDYSSFGEAIANINAHGVSAGGLTLNVPAGATFNEAPTGLVPIAGSGPITFQKSGAGSNPKLINQGTSTSRVTSTGNVTKLSATISPAVFALYGADNITLDGIDLETAEFISGYHCLYTGLGVFNISATDGATNNTFKNLSIKTTNTYTASSGIHQAVFVTPTNATGANSTNTYKNLSISNSYRSLYLVGNTSFRDANNIITADPSYTTGTNTVGYNDLGNITVAGTSGMRGIEINGQSNFSITNSEVRNIINTSTASTNDVVGILCNTTATSSGVTISNNIIHDITGSGTAAQVVYGIWFSGACVANVSNVIGNKVYKITGASTTSGSTRGILYSNSTAASTVNIINNMLYQLENPNNATGAPAIRGIELNGAINVNLYHNSVYLNAAYTGTTSNSFQTSCLFMASSTSTILDMKNNIFVNNSSTSSTGADTRAVAFYKSTATIGTQITTGSNNNLLYAGGASSKNLLYWGATAPGAQTLAQYVANGTSGINNGGGTRESAAVTENPPFISVTGTYDLHLSTTLPTYAESKGTPILTVTTDIDNDARNGTTPDIGADEFAGTQVVPCVTPTKQPTALIINATGQTTASGSFTVASPAPSNYLIVRTTASSLAATPVDATSYSVGTDLTFGAGGFVESIGSGTAISSTGLTAGTTYYYWIFSFNNNSCTGGPLYLTTSPLSGSTTTGLLFTSITSGNWENGTTWNQSGAVPNTVSDVVIAGTHTVIVNAVNANANILTVNATGILTVSGSVLTTASTLTNNGAVNVNGGTLSVTAPLTNNASSNVNVSSGNLNVTTTFTNTGNFVASGGTTNITGAATTGITNTVTTGSFTISGGTVNVGITDNTFCNRTFTNNGTLSVSSTGILNMYGNITNGASAIFNQSGGNINIDGNAGGTAANSVASGTPLLNLTQTAANINLTGGILTIVDPHTAITNTNAYAIYYNNAATAATIVNTSHKIRFGSGSSSDAGGNANGFYINNWFGNSILNMGSVEVNGLTGTNRQVTSAYQLIVAGDVTVNNAGVLNLGYLELGGNLLVNSGGSFIQGTAVNAAYYINTVTRNSLGNTVPSANAQTIGGSGTFANASTSSTANLNGLIINNTSATGVTFAAGLTPSVSGALTVTAGKLTADALSLTGTLAQTVTLTAASSIINVGDFNLSNSAGATLSGAGLLNVTGTVTPILGTLTAGGRLVLKSTSTGTARIGTVTGAITGNVTVERYFAGGDATGTSPTPGVRGFRFIAHPFSTNPFLNTLVTGGLSVTGTGGSTNGFTNNPNTGATNSPSAFSYDPTLSGAGTGSPDLGWTAYTNANTGLWNKMQGIRALFRGTNTQGLDGNNSYTVNPLTLTLTGSVNTGAQNFALPVTADVLDPKWSLVGNPYPSQIEVRTLLFNKYAAGVGNIGATAYVWNPNKSGTSRGGYDMIDVSTAGSYILPSCGVVLVQNTVNTTHNIPFAETDKSTGTPTLNFRTTSANNALVLTMKDANGIELDNTYIRLNNNAANTFENRDGGKMLNDYAIYTLTSDNTMLAIDSRPEPTVESIIPMGVKSVTAQSFVLKATELALPIGIEAYLKDKFLNVTTQLFTGTEYSFSVDPSNAATLGNNRFEIVMKNNSALPATFLNVTASQKNAGIEVSFTTANETNMSSYEVEESSNATTFSKAITLAAKNGATNIYTWFDATVVNGDNFYRIKSVEKNGAAKYSNVVKVKIGAKGTEFTVYPNPVKGGVVSLQMSNVDKGIYTVKIYNNIGQEVASKTINHAGGSATQTIALGKGIAKGNYNMQITNGTTVITKTVIVD